MRKRSVVIILVIFLLIIGGVAAWLFMSGQVRFVSSVTSSSERPASAIVCDDVMVARYNDSRVFKPRDGSPQGSVDQEALKQIATEIKTKADYEIDPTCQTILLWVAYFNKDAGAAKTAYEAVKSSHEKHIYANTNMLGLLPLSNYEAMVTSLSSSSGSGRG